MKRFKKISTFLVALVIVLGASATAYAADSTVAFESGKVIAFAPGSVYTDTDLFENFKGVMPGDKLTEEVTVQNNSDDCDYIKVYMRAIPHDEAGNPISEKVLAEIQADVRKGELESDVAYMYSFLQQMHMTVWNGSQQIFDGQAGELDGLAENVYLGTFRKGESAKLTVDLEVPIEMGNEYMFRIGEVDWVFTVEGFDDPKETPKETQTGDDFNVIPYLIAGLAALVVIAVLLRRRKMSE